MGRALVAALGGSFSVAAVGAALGIAYAASAAVPVAATGQAAMTRPEATVLPTPRPSSAAVNVDPQFAQGVAQSVSRGAAALQTYAAAPMAMTIGRAGSGAASSTGSGAGSSAAQSPAPTPSASAGPAATVAYTFTVQVSGFADLGTLGATIRGAVIDPTHYTLEFPESASVTRYQRDGAAAAAWVGTRRMTLAAGPGAAFGPIAPDNLLPSQLWATTLAPWADTLQPTATAGDYLAPSAVLTAQARDAGYAAADWTLKAHLDGSGRLTTLSFAGSSFAVPFALDMTVVYP